MINNYPVRRSNKQRRRKEIREKITNIILGALVMGGMIGMMGITGYIETHYNRECVVIEVKDDYIVLEDKCGYLWEYETDVYKINDKVTLKMHNSYTDNTIEDDVILDIK